MNQVNKYASEKQGMDRARQKSKWKRPTEIN